MRFEPIWFAYAAALLCGRYGLWHIIKWLRIGRNGAGKEFNPNT